MDPYNEIDIVILLYITPQAATSPPPSSTGFLESLWSLSLSPHVIISTSAILLDKVKKQSNDMQISQELDFFLQSETTIKYII